MKTRHAYLLLFSLPALLAAFLLAMVLAGGAAGLLWLFVLGDNPWPHWSGPLIGAVFALALAAAWAGLLYTAYAAGRRREPEGRIEPAHLLIAAGTTALLVAVAVAHQYRVGNLGPRSDGEACADYCSAKGFAGSGMPARNTGQTDCSCFDAQGREASKVPLETAREKPRK